MIKMNDVTTTEPPRKYGLPDSGLSTVVGYQTSEGVGSQVEKLRSFRAGRESDLQPLLQLGVALEAGRCADGKGGYVLVDVNRDSVVHDTAGHLGLPFVFEAHPQDNTLWIARDGLGRSTPFAVRYGRNMVYDDNNQVEIVVALHPDRVGDRTDIGALTLGKVVTLMSEGNGISAYETSRLEFTANTRDKIGAKLSAPCEISKAYDGKGLELRIKIPESRMR